MEQQPIPRTLLTQRYSLRSDMWGLRQEIARKEKKIADLTEQFARLKVLVRPHTRISKKTQNALDSLGEEYRDTNSFLDILRSEFASKRKELVKVEQALRMVYKQVGKEDIWDANSEEVRLQNGAPRLAPRQEGYEYDIFISHATEDKFTIVRPLVDRLRELALQVWYDEFELSIGDSLRESIDRGLSRSRYGLVVISPGFLSKKWTAYELNSLVAREIEEGKVVLPIWHEVTKEHLLRFSPSLADKVALRTDGARIDDIALDIAIAVIGG